MTDNLERKYPQSENELALLTFDDPTHTYRYNGEIIPSVSKILSGAAIGIRLNMWKKRTRDDKVKLNEVKLKTEQAISFGLNSHKAIEDTMNRIINDKISPDRYDALIGEIETIAARNGTAKIRESQQVVRAIRFIEKYRITPLQTELMILGHDKRYAGTTDLVGCKYGRPNSIVLGDWKSNDCTVSKFKQYKAPGYYFQGAAYLYPIDAEEFHTVHTFTGTVYSKERSALEAIYKKFELLVDLYYGKFPDFISPCAKAIIDLWNKGYDYKDVFMAFDGKVPMDDITNVVNFYNTDTLFK